MYSSCITIYSTECHFEKFYLLGADFHQQRYYLEAINEMEFIYF
jgi:hypothetical protein